MNDILCKDVCLLLPLYIDNMLSDEEMTLVREHLARCSECRKEYELLKGIMQQTENLPALEVSESFSAKLHEKLENSAAAMAKDENETMQKTLKPNTRWRIIPVAAACAAVIAVSIVAWNRLPSTDQFIKEPITSTSQPKQSDAPMPSEPAKVQESSQPSEEKAKATQQPQSTEPAKETNSLMDRLFGKKTAEDESERHVSQEQPETQKAADYAEATPTQKADTSNGILDNSQNEDVYPVQAQNIDESAATASVSSEPQASSSSGGGSSRSAKMDASFYAENTSKASVTATFYFEGHALEEAKKCMAGITESDGKYVIESSLLEMYSDILTNVKGYLSADYVKKDYTARYNELLWEQENGSREAEQEIKRIDNAVSQSYIVIAEK